MSPIERALRLTAANGGLMYDQYGFPILDPFTPNFSVNQQYPNYNPQRPSPTVQPNTYEPFPVTTTVQSPKTINNIVGNPPDYGSWKTGGEDFDSKFNGTTNTGPSSIGTGLGVMGTASGLAAGVPGIGLAGAALGTALDLYNANRDIDEANKTFTEGPAISRLGPADYFSAVLNTVVPFDLVGTSIAERAAMNKFSGVAPVAKPSEPTPSAIADELQYKESEEQDARTRASDLASKIGDPIENEMQYAAAAEKAAAEKQSEEDQSVADQAAAAANAAAADNNSMESYSYDMGGSGGPDGGGGGGGKGGGGTETAGGETDSGEGGNYGTVKRGGRITGKKRADGGVADSKAMRRALALTAKAQKSAMADGGVPPQRELSPLGFYSHAAEQAEALPQAKGTPQQMAGMLTKAGVKPAEIEHSKFNEAFADRPSVTREEVAQHFKQAMPKVEETVLGVPHKELSELWPTFDRQVNKIADKWGITNQGAIIRGEYDPNFYPKEALPDIEQLSFLGKRIGELSGQGHKMEVIPTKYSQYTLPGGKNYREVLLTLPEANDGGDANWVPGLGRLIKPHPDARQAPAFRSSHWDEPNVLAHVRMSDRTGPNGEKLLHVEELQSDWGQKGKKEGFGTPISDRAYNEAMAPHDRAYSEAINQLDKKRNLVPSAPYVTSTPGWTDLALKRVLKEAADGGYSGVLFTPGQAQADRYDLAKHINEIHYSGTNLVAYNHEGTPVIKTTGVPREELPNYIGKEAAEKLLNQPKNGTLQSLVGQDLHIGGEGMKGYYDKIVPTQLQKLVSSHDKDVKLGKMKVGDLPEMLHLPMTDKLRKSVQSGQKAFARGGEIDKKRPPIIDDAIRVTNDRGSLLPDPAEFARQILSKRGRP